MKRAHVLAAAAAVVLAGFPATGFAAPASGWTGYLDLSFGGFWGSESGNYFDSYSWNGTELHGAGKVAFDVAPSLTLQADLWATDWLEHKSDGSSNAWLIGGAAVHASWHPSAITLIGAFASYGPNGENGTYDTLGVEAQHWMGDTRFYGQVGHLTEIDRYDAGFADTYAEGVATHYINPNLSFAGFFGYDRSTGGNSGGWVSDEWNWGARVEYKPAKLPVSLYATYQGFAMNGNWLASSNTYRAGDNEVTVGLRVPLGGGAGTLKSLDQTVGLTDMNPSYGEIPH
jgi:hypothetical protein